jgi:phospholipid transport system transporter-binding protein
VSNLNITEEAPGRFAISGDLTFSTISKDTVKTLATLCQADALSVDLSRVANSDSAGLALMIEWGKLARSKNIALTFKLIPQQLLNLAKLSGLESSTYFNIQSED